MEFKPFSVYVGYDTRVTEYELGKRGKGPAAEVMNWLAESDISWQFNWNLPKLDSSTTLHEYAKQTIDVVQTSGGIFYFDTEEDRLLFCLRWLSGDKDVRYTYK
jgi:hypothetical protein